MKNPEVSVILPTYNEKGNIVLLLTLLEHVLPKSHECIVVDDDSPDGTSAAVRGYIRVHRSKTVRLITRMNDKGLVQSIAEGLRNANGKTVIWMDCDLSHPPEVIPKLLAKLDEGYDAVIATRFADGGKSKASEDELKDSRVAILLSKVLNLILRMLLGNSITDYTSGFIAVNKSALEGIPVRGTYGDYFIGIAAGLIDKGFRVCEVGYVSTPRYSGESKTSGSIIQLLLMGFGYVHVALSILYRRIVRSV